MPGGDAISIDGDAVSRNGDALSTATPNPPCCCGRACRYLLRCETCTGAGACGTLVIFICPESTCLDGRRVGDGTVILHMGHCWRVQAEHYYDCSSQPGGVPPADDPLGRCLPAGAALAGASTFECVACDDPRCADVDGYLLCTPCPGGGPSGPFPTVYMPCRAVYAAYARGCTCPTGCATLGDGSSGGCFYPIPGTPLIPDLPEGALLITEPAFCSCCECRSGHCGADHPFQDCAGGERVYFQQDCVRGSWFKRLTCCCNCRDATGTFLGVNTGYRAPGQIVDCDPTDRTTWEGHWDANGFTVTVTQLTCQNGQLVQTYRNSQTYQWDESGRLNCAACGSFESWLSALWSNLGRIDCDPANGSTSTVRSDCTSCTYTGSSPYRTITGTFTRRLATGNCAGNCTPIGERHGSVTPQNPAGFGFGGLL